MKMRKMFGLVLVVCLLVSMVSVISSGTVSAEVFDQNGNVVEGIEGVKYDSVYYNFDQEGGLMYGKGASVEDMVYLPNGDENGGGCYQVFADPSTEIPTSHKNFGFQIGSSSSATVVDTDAYTIYSGVKYKISYKIKFLSSYTYNDIEYTSRSTGSFNMRMVYGYSMSGGDRTAKSGIASVDSANLVKCDGYNEIQAGTEEWRTVEHELDLTGVTTNLETDLNGQYKGVLVFQTFASVGSYLIDDIMIVPQTEEATQYTYDFVDSETGVTNGYKDDGTIENVDNKCSFYYGKNPEDGVYSLGVWHTNFPADNTVDENGNITKFAFESANRTPIKDADVNSGEKIKLYSSEAKDYLITVKFKINSLGENSFVRFGIGTSRGSWEGDVTALKYKDYTQVSGDNFEYLTVIITDSMISQLLKDAESTTGYTYLYLIGSTEKTGYDDSATVLVYETTVTTLDRSVNNKNIIAHLNEDESVEKIELVAYGEHNQFGEYITYTSFDGEAIDKVTSSRLVKKNSRVDNAAGSNTVTFDEGYATSNHYKNDKAILSVVEDEEKGSVLKLNAKTDYNSPYRFSVQKIKFAKNEGKKYYITFEAKASAAKTMCIVLSPNTSGGSSTRAFISGYSNTYVKLNSSGCSLYRNGAKLSSTTYNSLEWTTSWTQYAFVIDTGSSDFQNVINTINSTKEYFYVYFGIGNGCKNETLYVDNLTVTEIADEAAEAPTEGVTAMSSIRAEGQKVVDGEVQYQSAGIRFRGYIPTATRESAAEIGFVIAPSKGISADTEWYMFDETTGKLKNTLAKTAPCYKNDGSLDVVYTSDADGYYYQLILTGLSREDGKTAYKTKYSTVMYVKGTDGTYTYYDIGQNCYNDIRAAYYAMRLEGWQKY